MTLVDSPPITRRPGEFNPREIASILVGGIEYTAWETVWAQERWAEAFSFFRFTTAENPPLPEVYTDLKIIPCDRVTVLLGGVTAISGWVTQRQVAYDADRHQVQIIGKANTFWPAKSSIETEDANMDNMNIVQMANKLVSKYGVSVVTIGDVDTSPFGPKQASPGGNIWQFLDEQAKVKKVLLSSNAAGELLLIGPHGSRPAGVLKEGVNIKKMQSNISIEDLFTDIQAIGQVAGHDQQNMGDANDMKGHAAGGGCIKSVMVIPVEDPVQTVADLDKRAQFEAQWTQGAKITCNITVQGWFNQFGDLWRAGQSVVVISPMVFVNQELKIKTVTWTQDSENGTETLLECVQPWALNGKGGANVGDPTPSAGNAVPQVSLEDLSGLGRLSANIGLGAQQPGIGTLPPEQSFPPSGSIGNLPPEAATSSWRDQPVKLPPEALTPGRGWPIFKRR
jgi:prophage tail gpP-like protein